VTETSPQASSKNNPDSSINIDLPHDQQPA